MYEQTSDSAIKNFEELRKAEDDPSGLGQSISYQVSLHRNDVSIENHDRSMESHHVRTKHTRKLVQRHFAVMPSDSQSRLSQSNFD